MKPFTEQTLSIIQRIPSGHIMTYGQIAKCAGNPRAARQVARILHSMSEKHQLPWHRVVNAKGNISFQDANRRKEQRTLLEQEGIAVINGRISLEEYQFCCEIPFE
ncbi:MGMT family protein [Halobacillus litoralis]|uniref:MGMT family protein n=1 Tax=Halobacillus litoralis TaxID=45668 RepID=UPI001CFCB7A9|nr:MGMT family protein [Halobacillus litoralis]